MVPATLPSTLEVFSVLGKPRVVRGAETFHGAAEIVALGSRPTMWLESRCFLLKGVHGRNVLINTGPNLYPGERSSLVFQLGHRFGISPDQVDLVVLSDLTAPHAGGVGLFPNARYLASAESLAANYDSQTVQFLQTSGRLTLLETGARHADVLSPEIEILWSHGVTPGQIHPILPSAHGSLIVGGSLFPGYTLAPEFGYAHAADLDKMAAERRHFLSLALERGAWLAHSMDPVVEGVRPWGSGHNITMHKALDLHWPLPLWPIESGTFDTPHFAGSWALGQGDEKKEQQDTVRTHFCGGDEFYLLADGHRAWGAEVSHWAVTLFPEQWQAVRPVGQGKMVDAIRLAVKELDRQIIDHLERADGADGGTTFLGVVASEQGACLVHVGDSRAYQVSPRDGTIRQLTEDHRVDNYLTSSLGNSRPLKHVDIHPLDEIPSGDFLVLVSDGFEAIPEVCLRDLVLQTPAESAAVAMIQSMYGYSPDNVSVIVLREK